MERRHAIVCCVDNDNLSVLKVHINNNSGSTDLVLEKKQ